jgi:hypothetical protein
MTEPRPVGRRWTPTEENQLQEMLAVGMEAQEIARELNRTAQAINARLHYIEGGVHAPVRSHPPACRAGAEGQAQILIRRLPRRLFSRRRKPAVGYRGETSMIRTTANCDDSAVLRWGLCAGARANCTAS